MSLFCLFGFHLTYLSVGSIRCRRCQQVIGETWPVLRPEIRIRAEREEQKLKADREQRAQAMPMPKAEAKLWRVK
jgi:hypothetical protein